MEGAVQVLAGQGYEPRLSDGEMILASCPFHRLAAEHTELVCGMNLTVLAGMAEALPEVAMTARVKPAPGWCCVRLNLAPPPRTRTVARPDR